MTQVETPNQSFLAEFLAAWPFNQLPDSQRSRVAAQLRLCTFQAGEMIYPPDELPLAVHCLVKGQVRLLGTATHQTPTLAVLRPGTVIGWDSLLRRAMAGSVRAAMAEDGDREVLTLALSADEFEALALQYLMPACAQQATVSEVFETFEAALANSPYLLEGMDLGPWVQAIQLDQLSVLHYWPHHRASLPELSDDRLWLVSGGDCLNCAIGTPIHRLDSLQAPPNGRFPIRLLGIPLTCLGLASPRQWVAPLPAVTTIAASPTPPSHYPIHRAAIADPLEDLVACFAMVCDHLQVPLRPDSLRRLLAEQSLQQFEPLDLYRRIAQAIGLDTHIMRFAPTATGLQRLQTPAILPCNGILTILYEVTPTTVVLGSPRTGLLKLAPAELATWLSGHTSAPAQSIASGRAIVLRRLPTSATQRFGFQWFIPLILQQRGVLIQVLLASIVIQLLGVANPLLVQQIIDHVIISANGSAMSVFGLLMVLFAILEGVLSILRTHVLISTTNRMDLHLGVAIVRHLLHLPLNFFEKRPVGDLSSRLQELETIRQFMTDTAVTTVMDAIFSLLYIGVMALYSLPLTLCVVATVPVIVISMLIMSAIQQKLIRLRADQGSQVQSYLVEVLGGISSVKSQHMESLVEATWRDRYGQYLTSGFTTSTLNTIFYSYSQLLNTLSSLLVLWVGADLVLKGDLSLGGLIAFRILTGYVTGPLLRLARLWQRFQETSLSMELLADIANAPTEDETSTAMVQMPTMVGRVQYRDVNFSFQPGQLQLNQVHLDITPGTFVGIVGQSGSGKSTLMKLLPRLYLPQTGQISIDGYDVSKVDLTSLRSQIGIVSQDAVLFQGTIRDNIALFEPWSDDEVIAAAQVSDAHDFIMQLPQGYSTPVGERGSALSGGQRQRIAIARIVIRNPQLLIFDEATSALDYETERRVCANLMQRFRGRTCFFITHRLNTIAQADWIVFMRSGIVAEQGTHAELIAHRQLYYCLYQQQSQSL